MTTKVAHKAFHLSIIVVVLLATFGMYYGAEGNSLFEITHYAINYDGNSYSLQVHIMVLDGNKFDNVIVEVGGDEIYNGYPDEWPSVDDFIVNPSIEPLPNGTDQVTCSITVSYKDGSPEKRCFYLQGYGKLHVLSISKTFFQWTRAMKLKC